MVNAPSTRYYHLKVWYSVMSDHSKDIINQDKKLHLEVCRSVIWGYYISLWVDSVNKGKIQYIGATTKTNLVTGKLLVQFLVAILKLQFNYLLNIMLMCQHINITSKFGAAGMFMLKFHWRSSFLTRVSWIPHMPRHIVPGGPQWCCKM